MTTQACLPTSTPTESRLVARGVEIAGSGGSRVSWADPVQSLLREPNQNHATLAVVGSHGHNHVTDALSWVVGELLHDGPRSVLVARFQAKCRPRCGVTTRTAAVDRSAARTDGN
jgi:hypothetical protein